MLGGTKVMTNENIVPICFSSDEGYLPFTSVVIQSIIDYASDSNFYEIHIFHNKIEQDKQSKFISGINKANVSIVFDDVSEYVNNCNFGNIKGKSITKEAYFRLLIPEILKKYEKVIYLDGDTLLCHDIAELMNVELGNNLLAAVKDYYGICDCYLDETGRLKYIKEKMKIENIDNLFNSGVLLINTKAFNETIDWRKILEISCERDWRYHDQDVLNLICKDRFVILDPIWNVIPPYSPVKDFPSSIKKEYIESCKNPYVVHYGGHKKPWVDGYSPKSKEFWACASKTPYFDLLFSKCLTFEKKLIGTKSFDKLSLKEADGDIVCFSGKYEIGNISEIVPKIYSAKIINDKFTINGFVYAPWATLDKINIKVKANGEFVDVETEKVTKTCINSDYYENIIIFSFSVAGTKNNIEIYTETDGFLCKHKSFEHSHFSKLMEINDDGNHYLVKISRDKLTVKKCSSVAISFSRTANKTRFVLSNGKKISSEFRHIVLMIKNKGIKYTLAKIKKYVKRETN